MKDGLEPCPFCGSEAYEESYGPGEFQGSVFCSNEDCAASGYNADSPQEAIDRWNKRASRSEAERLVAARKLVDKQAEDAGLWFEAQTAPEGYLQAALRELHAVIEGNSWFAPVRKE